MSLNKNKNIILYFIYSGLVNMRFWTPVIILYFTECNLNFAQIGFIQIWGYLLSIIFDVPTSVLSDKYGRKKFIIIEAIFASIGFFLFGLGSSLFVFILAETFISFGAAFGRGITQSYFYEITSECGNVKRNRIVAINSSLATIMVGVASLLGAIAAEKYGKNITFVLSGTAYFLSLFVIIWFDDVKPLKKYDSFLSHIRTSLATVKSNTPLFRCINENIIFHVVFTILTTVYLQPFFVARQIGVFNIGVFFLINSLVNLFLFTRIQKYLTFFSQGFVMNTFSILTALTFFLISVIKADVYVYLLFYLAFFCNYVRQNQAFLLIYKGIDTNRKATISSLINLLTLGVMSVFQYLFALIADHINLSAVYLAGVILLIVVWVVYRTLNFRNVSNMEIKDYAG